MIVAMECWRAFELLVAASRRKRLELSNDCMRVARNRFSAPPYASLAEGPLAHTGGISRMMTVLYTHPNSSAVQTELLADGAYLDSNTAGTLLLVKNTEGRAIAAFPVSSVLSATYRDGDGLGSFLTSDRHPALHAVRASA